MNIDQIGDLIEDVKSVITLEDFCRSYDIELLSENVENIKGQSSLYFSYRINSCGHEKTSRIGSIKRSGVTCNEYGGCKDEQLKNKYSELGLDLDFAACSITCNKCNTTYYREQSKLKKFLDKYKCYCELVPSNEYQVYKALQNKFGTELIRSYNKYGIPNKNYSADFYIRKNEVDYIIALDDKSHLGPINQGRDKCKIDIQLTKENTYSIYIEQRILFNSNCQKLKEEQMNQVLEKIEEYIDKEDKSPLFFMATDNSTFYNYLLEHVDILCDVAVVRG